MKLFKTYSKKNIVEEDLIVKGIEQARNMTYWFSERF